MAMFTPTTKTHLTIAALLAMTLGGGAAVAQHQHDPAPGKTGQPKHDEKPATPAKEAKAGDRVGDPYPLDTCPVTGKRLGAMGDPVAKIYDGREVRFCCSGCPGKFEKEQATQLAKIDEKIIKDQEILYPLKTSVVTGKNLPAKPFEFVYGNRLVRLGAESEKTEFLKQPKKLLADLDKAVVAAQGKDYPLKTCVVSKEKLGGDMGEAKDIVLAGRLIRLCCEGCKENIEKDPAKFMAAIDAARKGAGAEKPKHDDSHKSSQDKKSGNGK